MKIRDILLIGALGTGAFGNAIADLNNGLVAYYPFNGNANDESINTNHGVVHGAVLTTDRFGNTDNAYSFNGINNDIQIPIHSSSSEISISAWVKSIDSSGIKAIIQGSGIGVLYMSRFTTGKFFAAFDDTSENNDITNESITRINDGNWHFVMGINDGITTKIYVNSRLENIAFQKNILLLF